MTLKQMQNVSKVLVISINKEKLFFLLVPYFFTQKSANGRVN